MLKKIFNLPKSAILFIKSIFLEFKFVKWIKSQEVLRYTFYMMLFLILGSISILLIDKVLLTFRELVI